MLIRLPTAVPLWLATRATAWRKSFDSLAELARQQLEGEPLSGQLFVFRNQRAARVKLLYWDEDGFVILSKRLEAGTCRFPAAEEAGVEIRAADLPMVLDGIDRGSVPRQQRYRRPLPA